MTETFTHYAKRMSELTRHGRLTVQEAREEIKPLLKEGSHARSNCHSGSCSRAASKDR